MNNSAIVFSHMRNDNQWADQMVGKMAWIVLLQFLHTELFEGDSRSMKQ